MRQRRQDQVLRALAHHALDGGGCHRRQLEVAQHAVQGLGKVAERVDHGAVEVDDGDVEAGEIGAKSVQNRRPPGERSGWWKREARILARPQNRRP
ncbi:hypothetical protein D9M68_770930 [compost metagenome]